MQKNINTNLDLSILVVGYDGYYDVWTHFAFFINKFWKDRPKTYLATSLLEPQYENIEIIKAGDNSEWSMKAKNALDKINTKYVLLLLEDFFILDYIDNNQIDEAIKFIKNNDIKFYRLSNQSFCKYFVKGKKLNNKNYLRIITDKTDYALNLQAAIWNKEYLKTLIGNENYNGWEFEARNYKIKNYKNYKIEYLTDIRNLLNIEHAVMQSKYFPSTVYKCKKLGVELDIKKRGVLSIKDEIKFKLKTLMLDITPPALITPFKRLARHLKFNFVSDKYIKSK